MLCKWDASIITSLLRIITSLLRRPLLLPIITHFSLPNLQMEVRRNLEDMNESRAIFDAVAEL